MPLVRMLATTKVTMSHAFVVAGVGPTDAAGVVTATVKRIDGTDAGSGAATHGAAGSGVYSWPVTRAVLDTLTLDWTGDVGGSTVTARDVVEVVGGFYFGLDEATAELKLDANVWTAAKLARKRIQVEQECERICRQAFVPRFAREVLSGTGGPQLRVRWPQLRALRAVLVGGVAWAPADVAAVGLSESGVLTRPGGAIWPAGSGNVVVEYEHGLDMPPEDIVDASKLRLRSLLPRATSGVPDRTTSFTNANGEVYRLSLPTADTTGIPDVDGAYQKWGRKRRSVFA